MLTAHSAGLIQGLSLIAFGLVWPRLGLSSASYSRKVCAINLYGMYFNTFGLLLAATTGTRDLLYVSK